LAEQATVNRHVVGSIPTTPAIKNLVKNGKQNMDKIKPLTTRQIENLINEAAAKSFFNGYKAAKDKYYLELEPEANYYQHGHEVQKAGADHAKMKSEDPGVQLWTENSFITGYVTCLKDLFGESEEMSD
jgi:hypothetical protein